MSQSYTFVIQLSAGRGDRELTQEDLQKNIDALERAEDRLSLYHADKGSLRDTQNILKAMQKQLP